MAYMIQKEYPFEAAHLLPGHVGKCASLHGHSYKVVVALSGPLRVLIDDAARSDFGMVIDFGVLDGIMSELILQCDHKYLNESLPVVRTTAELLAGYFAPEIQEKLDAINGSVAVERVEVWETQKACAIWTRTP